MDNNKTKRIKIMDQLFSKGEPISFQDVIIALESYLDYKPNMKYFDNSKELAYGPNFRKDIRTIREILKAQPSTSINNMLVTKGSKKKMTYQYAELGFSIVPYMKRTHSPHDYKMIEHSLQFLKDNLDEELYNYVDFIFRSRYNYDFEKNEKKIDYGENQKLKGKEWLPILYQSIGKIAVRLRYQYFDGETQTIILHPYLLKQYNSRWFILGRCGQNPFCNVPLDRITNIEKDESTVFVNRPDNYFSFIQNLIGVSTIKFDMEISKNDINDFGLSTENVLKDMVCPPQEILIGIYEIGSWGRVNTKPLHETQKITKDFNGSYGQISINTFPNVEMYKRILSMGENIVIETQEIREVMVNWLKSIIAGYEK